MLILSEREVQSIIDIEELTAALEQAHIQYSTGDAVMPVRLVVPLPQIEGRITSMPGYLNEDKSLGIKVVTYFQNNPQKNLPAILATIMRFSRRERSTRWRGGSSNSAMASSMRRAVETSWSRRSIEFSSTAMARRPRVSTAGTMRFSGSSDCRTTS